MKESKATPRPWRIGDAGLTVFGPPNGNPSPETVAPCTNRTNAALIVGAVNAHDALVAACEAVLEEIPQDTPDRRCVIGQIQAALALAKGGDR